MKLRKFLPNLLLLFVSVLITLVVCEFVYRSILFGHNPKFKSIRKPDLYADYFNDDDYWKLYHTFGGEFGPPKDPHPLLGWIGDFDRVTLKHNEADSVGKKRPILLYGDSYAHCVEGAECFQSLLNNDTAFSRNNYLLNYGVGGYGVDQIALLLKNTYKMYDKPFVVFSIMCSDLDRSIFTNRIGQKPYFIIVDDTLKLKGVPVEKDPEKFFKDNPPHIYSYLWRRLLYSPRNPLPDRWKVWLKGENAKNEYKMKLNGKIMLSVIDELKAQKVDFVFLVFHYVQKGNYQFSVDNEDNWRDKFLKDFIANNKIPYIWSKELIRKDSAYNGNNIEKYMMEDNGHPTTYFNQLVADEIKKAVLASE